MSRTFLDYLTLPNPKITQGKCPKGPGTRSKVVYGPDLTGQWEDLTWQNLDATFKDVLQKRMPRAPLIKDATKIPLEKTEILEEESVTSLCVAWQESVLRHSLEGTHIILSRAAPDGPFGRGTIHFERNGGRGHIMNPQGVYQRPDWCAYQKVPRGGPTFPNLVPGDSKIASKWKSEWINSEDPVLRNKADEVMWQVTRYMWDAKTRYSFILSEEELVPLRLSIYFRDMNGACEHIEKRYQAEQMVDSSGQLEEADEENGNPGPGVRSKANPNGSWGDDVRKTGIMLEWCRIPWVANGRNTLTINLTLWWLLVLAVQDTSIKKRGTYTVLGEMMRGHSPAFDLQQTEDELNEEVYGNPQTQRKRRADDHQEPDEGTARTSKIHKGPLAIDTSFSSSSRRTRSSAPDSSTQEDGGREDGGMASYSFMSSRVRPRRLKHPKQRSFRSETESISEDTSQATDKPTHSFSSSFPRI